MKKSLFITLSVVTIMVACFATSYTAKLSTPQYSFTQPYQYPIVPGMPEWNAFHSNAEMVSACRVPDELVANMTTHALLETILTHPLIDNLFAYSTPTNGFTVMRDTFDCGLGELMERKDLAQVVYERYIALNDSDEDAFGRDTWFDDETMKLSYAKELEAWDMIRYLEVLAAQMQLDTGNRAEARLLAEIDRRHAYSIARNGFREKIDTLDEFDTTSVYYWTIQQEERFKEIFPSRNK